MLMGGGGDHTMKLKQMVALTNATMSHTSQ